MKLEVAHIVSFLTETKQGAVPAGEDSLKVKCPFHDDQSASAEIYLSDNKFKCFAASCGVYGDVVKFFAKLTSNLTKKEVSYSSMEALLSTRYGIHKDGYAPLAADPIELAHAEIWNPNPLVEAIRAKGITDDIIRKYRLGYHDGRIWIPIKDEIGASFINVRKYLPNAPGAEKMRNVKGRSILTLYPHDQMAYGRIVLCGGEMKALVAGAQLNKVGLGAVCVTGAEGAWSKEVQERFRDKVVYVCMDIDTGGVKAASDLCKRLYKVAKAVYLLRLPLDLVKYPKGDINNFIHDEHGDLFECLKEHAVEFVPQDKSLEQYTEGEYVPRNLSEAVEADSIGLRSNVKAMLVGIAEERYAIPKTVSVTCAQDKDFCVACNVFARKTRPIFEVPSESPHLLAMCNASNKVVGTVLRSGVIGIPDKCKANVLNVINRYGAELGVMSPPIGLTHTNDNDTRTIQKVLVLGDGIEPNVEYEFSVRAQADPRTQEAVLIASEHQTTSNSLDEETNEEDIEALVAFQPADASLEALSAKLSAIWHDLSCNVTGIYQREDLHAIIDMTYHSALAMCFDSDKPQKAYVESLVVGDTGQGKSAAIQALHSFYGLGHLVDCANVSSAGLIGGLQQLAGMWMISWGAWPTQDRKLIILEELERASVEIISSLTEMRSSGVAKLNKIRAGTRQARVRVIAASNPRSDRPIRSYGSGVEAVLELIGNPADVRRFDVALCVSAEDLEDDVVHSEIRPATEVVHTKELCRNLLLWVWKLRPSEIVFSEDVRNHILALASKLSAKYSDQIPLVDNGTIRLKLARLATAIAGRVYSTHDGGKTLSVEIQHVDWCYNYLCRTYDSNAMGYDRYSATIRKQETINAQNMAIVKKLLGALPFASDAISHMCSGTFIKEKELAMLAGTNFEQITALLGAVMRAGGLVYRGNNIILTSGFRDYLKTLDLKEFPDKPERM